MILFLRGLFVTVIGEMHSNKLYLSHTALILIFLPSTRQHQHSPPAHIVIPAVNPIPTIRLSTSSHGNNASLNNAMCSSNLQQQPPLPPTLLLIFRTSSTRLHTHTWKTTIIIHILHPYLVLRPLNLGSPYTSERLRISISYALHAQAALLCDALLDILCHNRRKTVVLPHKDNTAMIHDPVIPFNPLDDDYGGDDVVGRFQAAPPSHDRVLKSMVHHISHGDFIKTRRSLHGSGVASVGEVRVRTVQTIKYPPATTPLHSAVI